MKLIDILKTTLANSIEGSAAVQTYHWNIEGIGFPQYHEFFSEVYDMYSSEVDTLAEYIRIVSESSVYVSMLASDVLEAKTIDPDVVTGASVTQMITQIQLINQTLTQNYQSLFNEGTKANEQGIANYAASKLDELKKLNWKLTAISKGK